MSLGCDLTEAAAKAYAEGARSLKTLAHQIHSRYGETLRPEVLQAIYQKAADRYRTDYKKLDDIKAEMARTVVDEMRGNRSAGQRALGTAVEVSALPRAIMASGDMSMVLRQALPLTTSHPGMAAKAMADQARAMFGSRKYGVTGEGWAHSVDQEIKARPNYPLYEESGLFLSPLEKGIKNPLEHEEAFQSELTHKIPGVRNLVGASERAAVTYLNKMRADVFDDLVRRADPGDGSLPLEQAKEIAHYINNASGRGELVGHLGAASQLLSATFFSPKLIASRIGYLMGPGKMVLDNFKGSRFENFSPAQKAILYDYVKTLGAVGTVLGLAKLSGLEVGMDPTSSDFLKIKAGNMRFDVLGGFQQYLVIAARMATGQITGPSGTTHSLTEERFGGATRGDIVAHFGRSKLAPVPGMIADVMSKKETSGYPDKNRPFYSPNKQWGTDFVGKPTTPASYIERDLLPLTLSGFANSVAEGEGVPKALLGATAEALGAGVNTYNAKKKTKTPEQPIQDLAKKIIP